MAIKKKRLKNKKIVNPTAVLDKLNKLKGEPPFEFEDVPTFIGTTKSNEFTTMDGTILPSGITYCVIYDGKSKTELYLTGRKWTNESVTISRIKGETSFGQYKRLKGSLNSQNYFTPYNFEPQKKDFKRGFSYRFFGRRRFGDKKVIEISEVDFKKNSPMYTTIETRWYVGDERKNNEIKNSQLIEDLVNKGFIELETMNPMEGYTGPSDNLQVLRSLEQLSSSYTIEKKKKKIKKSSKKKRRGRNQSTQSTTTQAPSTGGGGGAY